MPLIHEPYDYTRDAGRHRRPSTEVGCLPYLYLGLLLIVALILAGAL